MRFEGRFSSEKTKEALEFEQRNKSNYSRMYALTGMEVYELLEEFIGLQLTTGLCEDILKKVGHRIVDIGHVDAMEVDVCPFEIKASTDNIDDASTCTVNNETATAVNLNGTELQEISLESGKKELSLDLHATSTSSASSEKMACKRLLEQATGGEDFSPIGAKMRRELEDANQNPTREGLTTGVLKCVGIQSNAETKGNMLADVYPTMKAILDKYSKLNEHAGDTSPFIRPSDRDFRDVTAFLMCVLLQEKTNMPRLCQNLKLGDVINPRITCSGARQIIINKQGNSRYEEYFYVDKELHEFLLEYNISMRGKMEGDDDASSSFFFRNTKGKSFSYGVGKDITRFEEKYELGGLMRDMKGSRRQDVGIQPDQKVCSPSSGSGAENQRKTQTRLVESFVRNVVTQKYPFLQAPPCLKDIEKEVEIHMNMCGTKSQQDQEYQLWTSVSKDKTFFKKIKDRWEYCNQEAIAKKALEMYRERPSDDDIAVLIKEYNLNRVGHVKMAGLWEPPATRIKRFGHAENEVQNARLLKRIENQDWPNLIVGEVSGRGRVVRATQVIGQGVYVCNFDGLLLEPDDCSVFLEKAQAHSNDPDLGRTEYCMTFKFDGRKYGKPSGTWMINANNEPESVGLKPSFGRLISHCRRHPNLRLVQRTMVGEPYVLLQSIRKILPGEELMYDYGDRATGLEDFMKAKNCICSKCEK